MMPAGLEYIIFVYVIKKYHVFWKPNPMYSTRTCSFQMAVCSDSSLITVVVPLWAAAGHHIAVYILGRVLNGSGLHLHDTAETTNVCVRFFVVFMTMRIWIVIL